MVGIGPGGHEHLTFAAAKAIAEADCIVGYHRYLEFLGDLIQGKPTLGSGMREEIDRVKAAIEKARAGEKIALISTGDAGIYGMAGLAIELAGADSTFDLEIVPGITAASSAAACLGAPLMNDFAMISLSDLLTPRSVIQRRLQGAVAGEFVIVIYNPRSLTRTEPLDDALRILREARPPETPVGLVRNALREGQNVVLTTLGSVKPDDIDMMTTVVIGNNNCVIQNGRMFAKRGYEV